MLCGLPVAHRSAASPRAHAGVRRLQLRVQDDPTVRPLRVADLFGLLDEVLYHRRWRSWLAVREQLLAHTLADALARLHGRLIYDLNKRRYRFDEPLRRAAPGQPGDFISHYDVRIEFDKPAEKVAFEAAYPSPQLPAQLSLDLQEPRHIYAPLLQGGDNKGVKEGLRLRALSISPDALNAGERKFVQDLHHFLDRPVNQGRLRKFDFYLMRNVESLRSVGWPRTPRPAPTSPGFCVVGRQRPQDACCWWTPRGQSGIQDRDSLSAFNAKVAGEKPGTCATWRRSCRRTQARLFRWIPSSCCASPRRSAGRRGHHDLKLAQEMQARHVLHLDWAPADMDGKRVDESGDSVPQPPDQRCYVTRMFEARACCERRTRRDPGACRRRAGGVEHCVLGAIAGAVRIACIQQHLGRQDRTTCFGHQFGLIHRRTPSHVRCSETAGGSSSARGAPTSPSQTGRGWTRMPVSSRTS